MKKKLLIAVKVHIKLNVNFVWACISYLDYFLTSRLFDYLKGDMVLLF